MSFGIPPLAWIPRCRRVCFLTQSLGFGRGLLLCVSFGCEYRRFDCKNGCYPGKSWILVVSSPVDRERYLFFSHYPGNRTRQKLVKVSRIQSNQKISSDYRKKLSMSVENLVKGPTPNHDRVLAFRIYILKVFSACPHCAFFSESQTIGF